MDDQKYPRVLIITLNPLSKTTSEKVFASFFEGYPKESIAQLYFHRVIPTSDVCDNYYRISDEDIVKYLMKRKEVLGEKVLSEEAHSEDSEERLVPTGINDFLKKFGMIRFLKSSLLSQINFDNEALNNWLEAFNPEVIFFCGGARSHVCKATIKISDKFNAKIIQYITDDYVLPYFSLNLFSVVNRYWTRKAFIKICKKSSLILTIGDKMSRVYKERYGIESKKLMSMVAVNKTQSITDDVKTNDLKFIYLGGLHSNRWKILALIGKSLERLEKQGLRGSLEIYSQHQPNENILNEIKNKSYSMFCGSLNSDGVKKVLEKTDVLVHVESFDRKSIRTTFLSISTKIPEYMASKKCILAVGPSYVASMEYIAETNSGFVINSKDESDIDREIKDIFINPDKRNFYIKQSLVTVKENHDIEIKTKEFHEVIIKLLG